MKRALINLVPLSHPRDDMAVCLFTDASDQFWGAVATQVPPDDLNLPLDEQRHEPLAFLSGTFSGASARWPIVEKEAFAIVESCKRLDYLLVRPNGFRLFTDQRNLVYIFNPSGSNSNMAKYQADKLQRWALVMSTFPYTIECVSGDANVWGDLLSRWASSWSNWFRLCSIPILSGRQFRPLVLARSLQLKRGRPHHLVSSGRTTSHSTWTLKTEFGCPILMLICSRDCASSHTKVQVDIDESLSQRNPWQPISFGRPSKQMWKNSCEAVCIASVWMVT